jgi:ATPase subunit of ABC transporter with duplicated ATPase domains
MLILNNLSYIHPDGGLLLENINLTLMSNHKIALIGNNGAGKSTLLKIIAGELIPTKGQREMNSIPYYVPQILGQYNNVTIAQALGVENKLNALKQILTGNINDDYLDVLEEDWTIETRCQDALNEWNLSDFDLVRKMDTLSSGQKTKVMLASISIHKPELVLLDEPSNHLDLSGREALYHFVESNTRTLIIVSHDRKLLNLVHTIGELSKSCLRMYGGNYDFYVAQKKIENNALHHNIQSTEKALRKAREKERETLERQQRLDARGKKKQERAGVPRIMMNTLRNNAEKSMSKLKEVHAEKIDGIGQELQNLRSVLPDIDKMKFDLEQSGLHKGKVLFKAFEINYGYKDQMLWKQNFQIQIVSGERVALKGINGSGKTTLIKILLGTLSPHTGTVFRAPVKSVYIDQNYSLINDQLTVYEQAQIFNISAFLEHEIKVRLNRFLFTKAFWTKPCHALSGGEKMRLLLCCLTISNISPDIIVLDEPTNNLDIQNIEILTSAINQYQGTLIVVSHDEYFLEQINIEREIQL